MQIKTSSYILKCSFSVVWKRWIISVGNAVMHHTQFHSTHRRPCATRHPIHNWILNELTVPLKCTASQWGTKLQSTMQWLSRVWSILESRVEAPMSMYIIFLSVLEIASTSTSPQSDGAAFILVPHGLSPDASEKVIIPAGDQQFTSFVILLPLFVAKCSDLTQWRRRRSESGSWCAVVSAHFSSFWDILWIFRKRKFFFLVFRLLLDFLTTLFKVFYLNGAQVWPHSLQSENRMWLVKITFKIICEITSYF